MPSPKAASVNLKCKIKLNGKFTFVPVAKRNDRYLTDQMLIGGVPTKVTGGTYYIEWYERGKRVQRAVGKNAHEAIAALKTQGQIHDLRASGVAIEQDAPQISPADRLQIVPAFADYMAKALLRPNSRKKYQEALDSFVQFTDKRFVDEVRRDDIRSYMAHLSDRQKRQSRTVKSKARIVHGVLKTHLKANITMERGDWPKVPKKSKRKMYKTDVLKKLLASVPRDRYILYNFFLHTGFRETEATHCAWADVDWERGEIRVTAKPHFDYYPKTYEERSVPVVPELMDLLREQREAVPEGSYLVFPTRAAKGAAGGKKPGGKPRLNVLDLLKSDYFAAGLNCGTCKVRHKGEITTCANLPQCKQAGIHMMRHTYATNCLRAGFSLADVARLCGHQDQATTAIYLHDLDNEEISARLRESTLGNLYTPDAFSPVERKRIHLVSEEGRRKMQEGGKRSAELRAASSESA